ncbi:MAG: hypothetical protein ACPIOQ_59675, partial [Promethearchaeia archaeon]
MDVHATLLRVDLLAAQPSAHARELETGAAVCPSTVLRAACLAGKYIFERGTLYRAERGVMDTWDAKMHAPGGIFSFFVPTSFSTKPEAVR